MAERRSMPSRNNRPIKIIADRIRKKLNPKNNPPKSVVPDAAAQPLGFDGLKRQSQILRA